MTLGKIQQKMTVKNDYTHKEKTCLKEISKML